MIQNRFLIKSQIGSGSFAVVHKGKDKLNKQRVAIKMIEPQNQKHSATEINILAKLSGKEHFPKLIWTGHHEEKLAIVMGLLGESLTTKLNTKPFQISEVLDIGIQIFSALKTLHENCFIHRDLKPDNIVAGLKKTKKYYLIDFGLSRAYIDERTKFHYPQRPDQSFKGNLVFCSNNVLSGIQASRRDDIISTSLILIFLIKRGLPWVNYCSSLEKMIGRRAIFTPSMITEGTPREIELCYNYSVNLGYYQTPDYDWILKTLVQCKDKLKIGKNEIVGIIKKKRTKKNQDLTIKQNRPSLRSQSNFVRKDENLFNFPTITIEGPEFTAEFRKKMILQKTIKIE